MSFPKKDVNFIVREIKKIILFDNVSTKFLRDENKVKLKASDVDSDIMSLAVRKVKDIALENEIFGLDIHYESEDNSVALHILEKTEASVKKVKFLSKKMNDFDIKERELEKEIISLYNELDNKSSKLLSEIAKDLKIEYNFEEVLKF